MASHSEAPFGEFGGPAVPIIAPCLASGTTVASEGHKTFCVDVEGSDGTLSYEGDWGTARGCRDGYGRIAFDHCAGCWVGPFVGDRPHGVVLWVEPCDDGADVTGHCDGDEVVAPVLFG